MMCPEHARQAVVLGRVLGSYIYSEETGEVGECKNCVNEKEKGESVEVK
jgi:hypothetical protein